MDRPTDTAPRSDLLKTAAMLAVHGLAVAVVLVVLLRFSPRFEAMFADFGAELPGSTKVTIALASLAAKFWYLLLPLLAVDGIVLWVLQRKSAGQQWPRRVWFWWWLVAAVAFLAFAVLTLWLPLEQVMQRLS